MTILPIFIWPAVALICFGVFVVVFRKPLTVAIARMDRAKVAGNEFSFGQLPEDKKALGHGKERLDIRSQRLPSSVQWENTGNVFWLGHDLMWTMQITLRDAPQVEIVRGLRQSYYHIAHIGLAESPPARRLLEYKTQVESLRASEQDGIWRRSFAGKLSILIDQVGELAGGNQPDFEQDVS
jgi:hypothetical protein